MPVHAGGTMNVLSLFDGIGCGRLALERAGIQVDNYFASEIDKHAIAVTQRHYPNIIQLGDVSNWRKWDLPQIDLLIGGSPCQGFSSAGKQLNFDDPRSKLFFEFIEVLKNYRPKHFLLENVVMKSEWRDIISELIGVKPVKINSKLVSAQSRSRLYWTNINITEFPECSLKFNGYLYRLGHGYIKDEVKFFEYYPALAAQSPATKYRVVVDINAARKASVKELRRDGNITRCLTVLECERLQTMPDNWTLVPHPLRKDKMIPKTQRYKMIGNAWTVDVIAHILKGVHDA